MIEFDEQNLAFFQKNGQQLTAKLTCTLLADKQVLVLNHIFINPADQQQASRLSLALVQAAVKYAQQKHLRLWPLGPAAIKVCQQISGMQALWYHKPVK